VEAERGAGRRRPSGAARRSGSAPVLAAASRLGPAHQLSRLPLALVASATAALAAAGTAGAVSVTSAQLRTLARSAASNRSALARIREVDEVDGRPVAIGKALKGASGSSLARRLRVLARGPVGGVAPSLTARGDARSILRERRFKRHDAPAPFRGVLTFLSEHVVRPIGRLFDGWRWARLFLAIAVVLVAAYIASRLVDRRAKAVLGGPSEGGGAPSRLDPRRLERQADEAERRGELELAIRLRFRAGLIRLDRVRAIELREPVTTGQVGRRLRSPDFDRVAASFDEIVYGGRGPAAPDVELSRAGWRSVLASAGAR
jgi:hypothetical protein